MSVKVDPGRRRITGVSRYNSGGVPDNFGHYFVVEFDRDVVASGVWNEKDGPSDGQELSGDHAGVWVRFRADEGAVVQARVATSFIGAEQAQLNFDREVGRLGFDEVKRQAAREWEELLGRVAVEGGSEAAKEVFYSCLYRGSLFPRTFHETDAAGRMVHYSPYNGKVEPGPLFTDNGFWDTFRAAFPLLTILHPALDGQIMQGIVNAYKESGWLPEWQSPGHRDCMIGTNSSAILADAWIKGIRGWDAEAAWEGIVKGAHADSVPLSSVGRLGAPWYDRLGYVPSDVGINESAARTLEYAYDDFCNWRLGKALGKPEAEVATYAQRARNYRNLFDAATGFMRGRQAGRLLAGAVPARLVGRRLHGGLRLALDVERLPRPRRARRPLRRRRAHGGEARLGVHGAPDERVLLLRDDDPRDRGDGRGRHGPVRARQPAHPAHDLPLRLGRPAVEGAVLGAPDDGPDVQAGAGHVLRRRGQRPDLGVVRDVGDGLLLRRAGHETSSRSARRCSTG